jgi:hypothetical protein
MRSTSILLLTQWAFGSPAERVARFNALLASCREKGKLDDDDFIDCYPKNGLLVLEDNTEVVLGFRILAGDAHEVYSVKGRDDMIVKIGR